LGRDLKPEKRVGKSKKKTGDALERAMIASSAFSIFPWKAEDYQINKKPGSFWEPGC
jgi:hypothetical protein